MDDYDKAWSHFRSDNEEYWSTIASKLHWHKRWEQLYETSTEYPLRWFVGGKLSLCYNCLDRPIQQGFGNKVIYIAESDLTNETLKFTYNDIYEQVIKLAGALHSFGVGENDPVLINLPLIPETVISILAIGRVGGVYLSVAESFTENSLRDRIEEFQPKVIITTNVGLVSGSPLLMKANLEEALSRTSFQPNHCIVLQRNVSSFQPTDIVEGRDITWKDALNNYQPFLNCVPVDAIQPLFLIFTSGSTGNPKAIVHAVGSFAVSQMKGDATALGYYDGNTYFSGSRFAWIAAHSGVATGPMLWKTTSIIYEAFVPFKVTSLYKVLDTNRVTYTFLATPQIRQIVKDDPEGAIAKNYNFTNLKAVIFGGAVCDEPTLKSFKIITGVDAIGAYGQTELASAITTTRIDKDGNKILNQPVLSCGLIVPGVNVKILREDASEANVGEIGRITIKLPCAPGIMIDIFNNREFLQESYYGTFPGYYDTKDDGMFDENGYLFVTNRYDDVYKVKGDRVSCDAIEREALQHPDIEAVAVVLDIVKNEQGLFEDYIPVGFYITKTESKKSNKAIENEMLKLIQINVCRNVEFRQWFHVEKFPIMPTSNKVAKGIIRNLVRNRNEESPPAEQDNEDVAYIRNVINSKN